jgi:hypothetical protein
MDKRIAGSGAFGRQEPVLQVVGLHMIGLADVAGGDEFARQREARRVAVRKVHRMNDPGSVGRVAHFLRLLHVHRQGLLTHDVQALCEGGHAGGVVDVV